MGFVGIDLKVFIRIDFKEKLFDFQSIYCNPFKFEYNTIGTFIYLNCISEFKKKTIHLDEIGAFSLQKKTAYFLNDFFVIDNYIYLPGFGTAIPSKRKLYLTNLN